MVEPTAPYVFAFLPRRPAPRDAAVTPYVSGKFISGKPDFTQLGWPTLTPQQRAEWEEEKAAGRATVRFVAETLATGGLMRFIRLARAAAVAKYVNCFPADTPVATEHGPKPIQDIRAADRVWAFDLVAGEWKLRRVIEAYRHEHDGDMVAATVAGEVIEATGHHPFWVVRGEALDPRPRPEHVPGNPAACRGEGRWVDAIDLRVGDVLLLRSGEEAAITGLAVRHARLPVYNFHVEDLHCYAVGHAQILVHNNSGSATAKEVSGWLRNEPASHLDPKSLKYFRDELQGPNHLHVWAEPIEVFEINGQTYVLNGHHRLTAAADVGYTGSIP